jgi:hypothetical protein
MKINANVLNTLAYRLNKIMQEKPETRNDDMALILEYKNRYFSEYSIEQVMVNHKQLGFPTFESITRCRRKIQEVNRELDNPIVKQARHDLEMEYKAFARE